MLEEDHFADSIARLLRDFIPTEKASPTLFVYPSNQEPMASAFMQVAARHCIASAVDNCRPFGDLRAQFLENDVIVFLEAASSTYAREVSDFLLSHEEKRAYRLFDFSRELLLSCFNCSSEVLQTLNRKLIALGSNALTVTVKSELGTDLRIGLDRRFGWVNSSGQYAIGRPGILPPSEVATFSAEVDGVMVVNGAINYNLGIDFDPRLKNKLVHVELANSRVISATCTDPFIQRLLMIFFRLEHSDRVGEIGFGTNVGLREFVPFVSHINERYPSFHLGLGSNNQGESVAGWQCPAHLDLILDECDIWFDDRLVHSGRCYCVDSASAIAPGTRVISHDTF